MPRRLPTSLSSREAFSFPRESFEKMEPSETERYDPSAVEAKWQAFWGAEDAFVVPEIAELVRLDFVLLRFGVIHILSSGAVSP